ncbi:hypothetical protein GLO73106DRAFT_00022280 [Gloeocapsa sp. PCC 73106]|nr:hypothetical protein GLO73106DRAFT_00022280 [Gloeocapsa sp. PCC 73106]
MKASIARLTQSRNQSGQVFISYRSKYNSQVSDLKNYLESGKFPGGQPKKVRYFPPGSLSDEIMTEHRRWQIVSMIDRYISPANEVWLYETDDYYDSWWTLAELATLDYQRRSGYEADQKIPKSLKIFNPKTKTVHDAPDDYLPVLSNQQVKRIARWYANCDAGSGGPEGVTHIRRIAQIPLIGRLKYFNDHVWSKEFWEYPVLECANPKCKTIGQHKNHFNVDDFLWTRGQGFYHITPKEMKTSIKSGKIQCPNCKAIYQFKEAVYPHYQWMPLRMGRPTGPDGTSLIKLPTYIRL